MSGASGTVKGSVFVVEDDLDVAEYYCLALAAGQMQLWGKSSTGEDAVHSYLTAAHPPDVVLLDHRLPGCTGLEAARQILDSDPLAVFVLVSADEEAIEAARAMGIKRTKKKPVNHAFLLKNLDGAIDEARALRSHSV